MRSLVNRRFVSLWVLSFVAGMVVAPMLSQFPVFVEAELHQSAFFAGLLRALFIGVGGLMALPGGALCDTLGSRTTFVLGLTGLISVGLIFLCRDAVLVFLLCLAAGAAFGLQTTAGQTYLIGSVPPSNLGVATAGYFLGYTLATAMGNFAIKPIVDEMGYRMLGAGIMAGALLIILSAVILLPQLPTSQLSCGMSSREALTSYLLIVRRLEVCLLLALRFLPTCYWGSLTLLVPLLLFHLTGTKAAAADYMAWSLLIAAIFQVLTGRICDRIGRKLPIIAASSLVALSALMTALFCGSVLGLYVFGISSTASAWSLSTTMPSLVNEIARADEKGRVLGTTHLAWSAGMLSGNLVGGATVEINPALPFLIGALCCGIALICAVSLFTIWSPPSHPPNLGKSLIASSGKPIRR